MKLFGHMRPTRDDAGQITGSQSSPVRAKTLAGLSRSYGPDHDKRLVVSLDVGDVVTVRPERTRRALSITAVDLYAYLIRCEANRASLVKARAKKDAKATRLAAQRQDRAEKRLVREARRERLSEQ